MRKVLLIVLAIIALPLLAVMLVLALFCADDFRTLEEKANDWIDKWNL